MTRAAYQWYLTSIAALLIVTGQLLIMIAVHDAAMPEDLTTLWACSLQGNGLCGPDTPWIQFAPANLFYNWDMVIQWWLGRLGYEVNTPSC